MFYRVFLRHSELKNPKFSRSLRSRPKKYKKNPFSSPETRRTGASAGVKRQKCQKITRGDHGNSDPVGPTHGKRKNKTQKFFALATLAVLFLFSTFTTENQAPTGDYGRWLEILIRGDPWKSRPLWSDPRDFGRGPFFLVRIIKLVD